MFNFLFAGQVGWQTIVVNKKALEAVENASICAYLRFDRNLLESKGNRNLQKRKIGSKFLD